jgi:hypothetical protein
MVVWELTRGIYFGKPKGFGTNEKGEDIDFNTEVYSVLEDPSSSEATTGGAGPGATWGTTFVKQ